MLSRWMACVACSAVLFSVVVVASPGSAQLLGDGGPDGGEDFVQLASGGFAEGIDGPHPEGSSANSYSWSSAIFDGRLYVGTVRNAFDAENTTPGDRRGEIWRYDPGTDGTDGTWDRVYQSPVFFEGVDGGVSREIGYRGMTVCDAGDGVERLYVSTIGLGGRVIYTEDGESFQPASAWGLDVVRDIGYRSLVCARGWLYMSPVGTFTDSEGTENPVVLASASPTNGRWRAVSEPGFGRPDTSTVMTLAGFDTRFVIPGDDMIVAGSLNRETGVEIHMAPACHRPLLAVVRILGLGCAPEWELAVSDGAGRPLDEGVQRSTISGAMEQFGDRMYISIGETRSFTRDASPEMIWLEADGSFGLVMGVPREPSTMSAYPGFECESEGGLCVPESGSGPGWGGGGPDWTDGSAEYVWDFEVHEGYLYATTFVNGTLNPNPAMSAAEAEALAAGGAGFDLWRTSNGVTWEQVFDDGLGNPLNSGGRTMASSPDGLYVGTANSNTVHPLGGTEVWLGRCLGGVTEPVADAGVDRVVYDEGADGEDVLLRGSGSGATSCGDEVYNYAWSEGACGATTGSISDGGSADVTVSQGSDTTETYSLVVRDTNGSTACDEVVIDVSTNAPPEVTITTTPAAVYPFPGAGAAGFLPTVRIPDGDDDDFVDVPLLGECIDTDLVSCEWYIAPSTTLADPVDDLENIATVPVGAAFSFRGVSIWLIAEDAAGNRTAAGVSVAELVD